MSIRKQYPFNLIEPKWQKFWDEQQSFRAFNPGEVLPTGHPFAKRHGLEGKKVSAADLPPKFYVLDMFPYPSGAGLHVGHPEGYTATDILARYKRAAGAHVLHPMGWDSFGLPAEQYAVKTGQHPRVTTEANIANFTRQIKSLGFSYDWSREVATTDPEYFRWTQWIFLQIYNSWFNPETNKVEPISTLKFPADCTTEEQRRAHRDSKRLAYVSEAPVNWCPELGTVLANEEVIDGKSEVGGFPVVRKPMRQWLLRITACAEKLLNDLDTIDWSDSLKEMQRNWIGRSEGAEVDFAIADCGLRIADSEKHIRVFTTRPDTLFGATYMVLAPEHKLVDRLFEMASRWENFSARINREITAATVNLVAADGTTREVELEEALQQAALDFKDLIEIDATVSPPFCRMGNYEMYCFDLVRHARQIQQQRKAVDAYRVGMASKSDLERTELAKEKSGVFTGAYAVNPVHGGQIPIWIADYVLASYGTGAIMAVPGHDTRDFEFAQKFNLPVIQVVEPPVGKDWKGFTDEGTAMNSVNEEFSLDGLPTAEAKAKITAWLEAKDFGKKTINYKLRDWLFSRQRYWGEPFPIIWKKDERGNEYHEAVPAKSLPVLPPDLDDYKPTGDGQPPLARARAWVELKSGARRETNTMPQWAGSCWYYLRYLDAGQARRFVDRETEMYWMGGERPAGVFPLLSTEAWHAEVQNLWRRAFADGQRPPFAVEYARVSPTLAARIKAAAAEDVSDFYHTIDVFAVRHVLNKHGIPASEEARGNVAVTLKDLEQLPEILSEPDSVEFSAPHPQGFKRFVISKRINGTVFVVEEARTRHHQLQLITLYKKRATARDVTPKAPLSDTSETFRRSDTSRPDDAPAVKSTPGVDLYVGGTEHAVLHLLYARFWHKILFDLGHVSTPEPFFKLVNQGLILGEDGQKMSKSRGNVVNPDDVLAEFGADAFRLYEMFMGPLEMVKPWNTQGVSGVYKFLGRVWRLFVDESSEVEFEQTSTTADAAQQPELLKLIKLNAAVRDAEPTKEQLKVLHACIKKVTEDLEGLRFNTAISAMMVFVNEALAWETKPASVLREFLILLQPFAPHIAEELWEKLSKVQSPKSKVTDGGSSTLDLGPWTLDLAYQPWPKFDPALLVEDTLEIPVQINGKLRDVIRMAATATSAEIEAAALKAEKAQPFLAGKTVKKVIVVPKKLVNIVAV